MKEPVVVRFAPSPTGPLHIGGVRTALYNYLFARQMGGKFILRIEDTDQTRYVPGAEEYILEALQWCGITFDEGVHQGGPHGPYRQSERKELYREYAMQLVDTGKAYLAFDTEEEIEAMREQLKEEGHKNLQYNFATRGQMKNSLTLSPEEVQARLEAGEPYVVRMLIPRKEEIRFHDLVRDWVVVHSSQLDDKVLLKSDGMPTYHLANVVDDRLMGVTHVIRGEEWLPSTPLHVLLYRAFGWEEQMPRFVHLPLILKPSGNGKLSKRDGVEGLIDDLTQKALKQLQKQQPAYELSAQEQEAATAFTRRFVARYKQSPEGAAALLANGEASGQSLQAVRDYLHTTFFSDRGLSDKDKERLGISVFPIAWTDPDTGSVSSGLREDGYLPEAVLNFLALLGWNPGSDEEVMSLDRMVEAFSMERIHKSGARYDPEKLNWFNQTYLRAMAGEKLLPLLKAELNAAGVVIREDDYLLKAIELMRERVTFPKEMVEAGRFLFETPATYDEKMARKQWKPDSGELLQGMGECWRQQEDWQAGNLEQAFSDYIEENGLGKGRVLAPLRLALTGTPAGPGVFEIAELIGREESLYRISKACQELPLA